MTEKKKQIPALVEDKTRCCGCSACQAVCPADAIRMEQDEEGFFYPVIDPALCIRCHRCIQVCIYR